MRKINLELKESLLKRIEKRASDLHLSPEQVISKTLEDFFYLERLRDARDRYSKRIQFSKFDSEEKLFDEIS